MELLTTLVNIINIENEKIISAIVSDLLGEFEWTPAFGDDKTGQGLGYLFDTIVENIH